MTRIDQDDPPRGSQRELEDPLNPRTTALLVIVADLISVVAVLGVLFAHVHRPAELGHLPLLLPTVGAGLMVTRTIGLQVITQGWKAVLRSMVRTFDKAVAVSSKGISGKSSPAKQRPVPQWLRTDPSRVDAHRTWWLVLLGVGMLAQVLTVAGSGGLAESPFTELLITTFILGQFRSPTGAAIWTLFGLGIFTSVTAHLLYLGLRAHDRKQTDGLHWSTWAHVVPLLIVGVMSTVVSYFLRRSEAGGTEPSPDEFTNIVPSRTFNAVVLTETVAVENNLDRAQPPTT